MEVRNVDRMERMKRSQSSNGRPRTRLSRSFSATSPRKHGWKVSIAVVAGGTLLLVSVFFLQARLGGFGSPVKSLRAGGTSLEVGGTYEDDDNLGDVEPDKLNLFEKVQQRKLVDGGGMEMLPRMNMDDLEEEEDGEFENFDEKVDGKLEELEEDEMDVDDAGVEVLKPDEKGDEDDDDDEVDESQDFEVDEAERKHEEAGQGLEDNVNMTQKRLQRLGQIKTLPRRSPEVSENSTLKGENNFLWDHLLGIIKMPVKNKSTLSGRKLGMGRVTSEADDKASVEDNFSSDDQPMDSKLRQGVNDVADVEDALMLRKEKQLNAKIFGAFVMQKPAPLRNVFDSKFARKVAKPPYDPSNPTGNVLLQDPDTVEPWGLTKNDKVISKAFRNSLMDVPVPEKKNRVEQVVKTTKRRRKELLAMHEDKIKPHYKRAKGDNRKWGWFPGVDTMLSFSEFMEQFMMNDSCELRVFMAWNTPPWSFTVRHQRGLESLLHFHPKACVTVFSETIELDFFKKFVNRGYRVAVVRPNLEEFLEGTPAEVFASVWLQWRKTDLFYIHYSELLRLAALYRYGGIYLDSDIIVLKPLDGLRNSVGLEPSADEEKPRLNGAVMVFDKESHFILACLEEYTASYDDKRLDWNGADLVTRVAGNNTWPESELRPLAPNSFFPLSRRNITRYFHGPMTEEISPSSYTLHLWNHESASLVPEKGSLVGSALERHCIWCSDII